MTSPFRNTHIPFDIEQPVFFNENCIDGAKAHLLDDSIDVIITDPPYGIGGDTLHRHYNRDESFVIDGYVEVPKSEYQHFSDQWISQAARVLKPGGSLFIVSGYTNLFEILAALRKTSLKEVNHIIWKYNFGVYTTRKFVTSHYHILFYEKPGGKRPFHRFCRFSEKEKSPDGRSLLYQDLEDVWILNREYKPAAQKNKNELPFSLLAKLLQYTSQEADIVADFFLGSFSTAKVAKALNRKVLGFELNKQAFSYQVKQVEQIIPGSKLEALKRGKDEQPKNRGKIWEPQELERLFTTYDSLQKKGYTKTQCVELLGEQFGRGRFAVQNALKRKP
jgi:site-specific DNA-methyltransferase (adenine-specific)